MASRNKQKQDDRKPSQIESQAVDKKINELQSQIVQSRIKLDNYVTKITSQIGQIVNYRLNKFVTLHSQIISQKDHQIKMLQEFNEQARLSQLGQNVNKLMKTINNYELQIERLNTIKEMFRKQSQRFKIELEIREKELEACKKRQKILIKKIWVLQEDIKDIYSAEQPIRMQTQTKMQKYRTPKKDYDMQFKTKNMRIAKRIINTQPTQINEGRQRLQSQLQQKYSVNKANLFRAASSIRQKFSIGTLQKRGSSSFKSNSPSMNGTYLKQPSIRPFHFSNNSKQIDIYEDLRHNLRKASRLRQVDPYWNDSEKSLHKQDFRSICLYGPKIMQQIEKVFINNYGQLKQIDEYSIQLLQGLFKNDNAIKILEIVLFNYSLNAIHQIEDKKQQLINQISYNQPSLELESYQPLEQSKISRGKPKKIKMQNNLRQKFKKTVINKTYEHINSHRLMDE